MDTKAKVIETELPSYCEDYLVYMESILGKSAKTIKEYKYDLILFFSFIADRFKKNSPADLSIEDLNNIKLTDLYAYVNYLTKERGDKAATRSRKVSSLRSFFKYAHKKAGLIKSNPAQELDLPKLPKKLPRYLDVDDSKNLLLAVDGDHTERDYCILTLFLNCGMRLSELVGINTTDIKGNRLTVMGKGSKERTIYLNDACVLALARYLAVRQNPDSSSPDRDALFLSERNKRMSPKTVEYTVKKFLAKAGLDTTKLSTHKLRHTAATLMYTYGGVDIRSLQEILGHASISTTEIYTHVNDKQLAEAVSKNPLAEFDAAPKSASGTDETSTDDSQ